MKVKFLISLLFLSSYAYSNEVNKAFYGDSLCMSNEVINFYCILENKRTVSVCSGTSEGTQYSKYRYGTQDFVEMEFPKDIKDDNQKIYYADLAIGSVNQNDNLFFSNGNHNYVLWLLDIVSSGLIVNTKKDGNIEEFLSSRCDTEQNYSSLNKRYDYDWHKKFPIDYKLYGEYFYE